MSRFLVTQCVCYQKSFVEIKDFASQNDIDDLMELKKLDYCSNKCTMCAPYVEIVLKTGATQFEPGSYIGRKMSS